MLNGFLQRRRLAILYLLTCLLGVAAATAWAEAPLAIGDTRVAKWKDDRKGVFLLMFDDSWPSHWQVAAPELAKRGLIATFYICPAKGEHAKFAATWEKTLPAQGMVYGDHTMTHKGVKDLENAEYEIGECARVIRKIAGAPETRLVSYGQPGVAADAWKITAPELESLLAKYHLVSRPPFTGHGAVYHLQKLEQMIALLDRAEQSQGMEYLVVHGVERITPDWHYQDMWPLKQEILLPLLDEMKLRSERGELWVTDHISQHQYETERNRATVQVLERSASTIRLALRSEADPKSYDQPLTLVTQVPPGWKQALVKQGAKSQTVAATAGSVRFDAWPGADSITVQAAKP